MSNPNVVVSSDHGSLIINVNDFIGRTIVQNGYWAKTDIALIQQILGKRLTTKERLCIYDVGANIGAHTVALAKFAPGRIAIRAFEAQRQIFYMLCGNVAINGLRDVHCHNLAVSRRSGDVLEIELPDYDQPGNFGGLELMPAVRSDNDNMIKRGREFVTTVGLDEYDESVDFLKMDIEGMEDQALEGAAELFNKYRPACFLEIAKTNADAVLNFFRKLDYVGFLNKTGDMISLPREEGVAINGATRIL